MPVRECKYGILSSIPKLYVEFKSENDSFIIIKTLTFSSSFICGSYPSNITFTFSKEYPSGFFIFISKICLNRPLAIPFCL